jgi:hypothetical protein
VNSFGGATNRDAHPIGYALVSSDEGPVQVDQERLYRPSPPGVFTVLRWLLAQRWRPPLICKAVPDTRCAAGLATYLTASAGADFTPPVYTL